MSEHEASSDEAPRPERYVQVSHRPPSRYAAATTDLDLWLKRFELYVRQLDIPEEQWAAELLPLLDDEAFRVVSQLGLESSTDYGTIVATSKQQFSPKENKLEWQHKLQTRRQQSGEELIQYAGALRVLADKAYPNWTAERRREVLRNHFIQGITSPSVQLRLMREMPRTFDDALELAMQLQSVETAQKRLYKEVHHGEASAMSVQLGGEPTTSHVEASATNAGLKDDTTARLEEMTKELRRISWSSSEAGTDEEGHGSNSKPQELETGRSAGTAMNVDTYGETVLG